MIKPLTCIVCGHQPESAIPEAVSDWAGGQQPYGATTFNTHGQYGSTVFDEMGRSSLQINVCDACVLAAAADGRVLHCTLVRTEQRRYTYELWEPPAETVAYLAERAARGEDVGGVERATGIEPA